jgi:hypothetical protein
MLNRILLLAVCCAVAASWAGVRATVLVPAEFREVVTGADIIAYGRVTDTTVVARNDRRHVETLVTLHVATYLKGAAGEHLVFSVPGGQIGRYRHVLVGAPRFDRGEETVVFLNARGSDRPVVFGLNQGVFRVRLDNATKRRLVLPPAVLARSEQPEPVVRGAAGRGPVALETFGAQVHAVLAEAAGDRR